jgi:hypothetical protein
MGLNAEQTGPADLTVFDDGEPIAEIRQLTLAFARFRRGGRSLIGDVVPLPLYWMQYANHQDPERNTGTAARVTLVSAKPDAVMVRCTGTTGSGACRSTFVLAIHGDQHSGRYTYLIDAKLDVVSGQSWRVTPNLTQGEVEFANLWPDGTFSAKRNEQKRYQACYLVTPSRIERISHHHLESSDKHNIPMKRGDRFLWLQEDENLCLVMRSEAAITAGVCAYMWDTHFAYEICGEGKDTILPAGTHFEASYELSSLAANETAEILAGALDRPAPELATTPLYVRGINRFSETLQSVEGDLRFIWPWETEGTAVSVLTLDQECGFDDSTSVRIDSENAGRSCWKATTLGPAFGDKPFVDASRYELTALVKTANLEGRAMLAIRLHRENSGSVFNIDNYEVVTSMHSLRGTSPWTKLEVITPPISPAPDRLHLLLIQEGKGTTWFDNVLLEVLR